VAHLDGALLSGDEEEAALRQHGDDGQFVPVHYDGLVADLDGTVFSGDQEEAALRQHGDAGHVRLFLDAAPHVDIESKT